jgi:hypothetical protein
MAWIGVPLTTPRRTLALAIAKDAAERIAKVAPSITQAPAAFLRNAVGG